MILGSREVAFARTNEGLTWFSEALARADYDGNRTARMQDQAPYLQAARAEVEAPWTRRRHAKRHASVEVSGRVERIILDPERFYPDLDRTNNVWPADPSIS